MKQKQSLRYTFKGELMIPQQKSSYCVFDKSTPYLEMHDLGDLLKKIYYGSKKTLPMVDVKVNRYDGDRDEYVEIFNNCGELLLNKSEGVYDWFVGECDLGKSLFYNTKEKVHIEITDMNYLKNIEEEDA